MERIKTREERALPRSSWLDSEFASGIFININGSSTNIFVILRNVQGVSKKMSDSDFLVIAASAA